MATASTSDNAAESSQQAPVTSAPAADTPGLDVSLTTIFPICCLIVHRLIARPARMMAIPPLGVWSMRPHVHKMLYFREFNAYL